MEMTQTKTFYPAHQQVKYLHLQAEVEVLLQQIQTIRQQQNKDKAL